MIWKMKLIILILTISVHGTELKTNGHIQFEDDRTSNDDTTGPVLENGQNFYTDYNINYDDPIFEDKDHKQIKFNNDYAENVDYQDINVETPNENKRIVFKDEPNSDKIEETVKNPVKFEFNEDVESSKTSDASEVSGRIAFDMQDTNQKPDNKKRRKRRRKPKNQSYPGPLNPNLMYPGHPGHGYGILGTENGPGGDAIGYPNYLSPYPAYPQYPASVYPAQIPSSAYPQSGAQYPGYIQPGYADGNPGLLPGSQGYRLQPALQQPGFQGHRPRRPKSLANKALSALSEALSSIATNDDQQCVPRLLCEAAGGRTSGSTSLLQSVAGLDPLLSMLSAYNGVSSSPLFVFGRAVILGMTSKGNTASCRYAYPQCPTDPDKLIHYLNNHNGGFFRFFNAPVPQQNQNVEQFYNQLAGQYGLYQPNDNLQNFGQQHQYGLVNQNLYSTAQNYEYGPNKYGFQQYKKDIQIDRIQNKPIFDTNDDRIQAEPISISEDDFTENGQKWLFPDEINNSNDIKYEVKPSRVSKTVKFPEDNKQVAGIQKDYVRKGKNILFPEYNTRIIRNYDTTTPVSINDYVFDYKHNFYVKRSKVETQTPRDDGVATVYIVRGNGDPNHPEIVKIKRGKYV